MTAPINLAELKDYCEDGIIPYDSDTVTGHTVLTLITAIEVLREALKEYSILEVDGSVDYNIAADALAKIKEIVD